MYFKDKPLKKIVCDSRVTLDVIHQDKVRQFTEDNKAIQEKKDMLHKYECEYKKIKRVNYLIQLQNYKKISRSLIVIKN